MRKIFLKSSLILLSVYALMGLTAQAQADTTSTTITFVNATSSNISLLMKPNLSGSLSPEAPQTITTTNPSVTLFSETSGDMDGGTIYYGTCRFNWSTVKNVDPMTGMVSWTFSQLPATSSSCSAIATTANYSTGAHAIIFTVKK